MTSTSAPIASTSRTMLSSKPAGPPPVSPLKQVNAEQGQPIRTKLETCWQELTTNKDLFATASIPQLNRYFNELFCLKPNPDTIENALDRLELDDLLGAFKNNISYVFIHATKIFKESEADDMTRANIVETLIPFLRNVLSRPYHNFSFETMNLLAGSLAHSDTVFTNLVSSIDMTLQDRNAPTTLRHRALQLALVLVASINQGSINAYFLRRDLFSTLVSFMTDDETSQYSFESALLLGLLANYRQYESRNPYRVRIEDMVEETVMSRVIDVVQVVCGQARDSFTSITDDAPASFVASITSLIFSFRVSEFFKQSLVLSLPPPPPPRKDKVVSSAEKAPPVLDAEPTGSKETNGNEKVDMSTMEALGSRPTAPSTPSKSTTTVVSSAEKGQKEKREENLFKNMPNEVLVILLPFYDLLNLNKSFCALALTEVAPGKPSLLPPILISLSSYVLCHASVSSRARCYARLCLLLLMILVEESDGKLSKPADEIRICRQRIPMLQRVTGKRPAMAAMLDCTVIFLRHNLRKKLDVETYIVCLRLIQRILQQLKTERVRLAYDWVTVWRSILSLAAFIVSQISHLRLVSSKIDDLTSQIFILLSYAAYWGETLFPTSRDSALLFYELLHADATLRALSDLLGISSVVTPTASTNLPTALNPRSLAALQATPLMRPSPLLTSPNAFDLAPRKTTSVVSSISKESSSSRSPTFDLYGPSSTAKGFIATECVSNLHLARSHFISSIDRLRSTQFDGGGEDPTPDPEAIVQVIEASLEGLELIESSAMGDMRKGAGLSGLEGWERGRMVIICEDALGILCN